MEGSVEESLSSTSSFSFHHSLHDSDAYFDLDLDLDLCPHSHSHHDKEFEFRVSFSALVPFPGFTTTATASLSSIPPAPSQPPATPCEINTWSLVHTRKVQGLGNKSTTMMMKFLVKRRSIVSVRGSGGEAKRVERWLRKKRVMKEEGQKIMLRNKFIGNPFNTTTFPTASASSCVSPPVLFHQAGGGGDHASSLLHSAIAHCKKSLIP